MNQIANVKWDDKEMPMEHNVYVNDLIKEFRVFSARMADIATLSQKQKKVVWEVWAWKKEEVEESRREEEPTELAATCVVLIILLGCLVSVDGVSRGRI